VEGDEGVESREEVRPRGTVAVHDEHVAVGHVTSAQLQALRVARKHPYLIGIHGWWSQPQTPLSTTMRMPGAAASKHEAAPRDQICTPPARQRVQPQATTSESWSHCYTVDCTAA
jgi:hypothetical protein